MNADLYIDKYEKILIYQSFGSFRQFSLVGERNMRQKLQKLIFQLSLFL